MDEKKSSQSNSEFLKKFSSLDIDSFTREKESLSSHERKEILTFLIETLPQEDLELLGACLDEQDISALLGDSDFFSSTLYFKASPLFIRMPIKTFENLIRIGHEPFIFWLKKEAEGEPLQHLISRFSKQMAERLDAYYHQLKDIEENIQTLDLKNLTNETLDRLKLVINDAALPARLNLIYIEKALLVAWLSLRSDLVDELSFFKESWIKFMSLALGTPKKEKSYATGLYLQLDLKLASIFKKNEFGNELNDDEPVQEGLTRFSLWQLQDFAEIGLIDESKEKYSEEPAQRSAAIAAIREKLEKAGLRTIKDLKENEIYSKYMLKAFLDQQNEFTS